LVVSINELGKIVLELDLAENIFHVCLELHHFYHVVKGLPDIEMLLLFIKPVKFDLSPVYQVMEERGEKIARDLHSVDPLLYPVG